MTLECSLFNYFKTMFKALIIDIFLLSAQSVPLFVPHGAQKYMRGLTSTSNTIVTEEVVIREAWTSDLAVCVLSVMTDVTSVEWASVSCTMASPATSSSTSILGDMGQSTHLWTFFYKIGFSCHSFYLQVVYLYFYFRWRCL